MGRISHQVVAALAGCLISAPLCAYEKQGLTVTLSQEEDDACRLGGGCLLVPISVLKAEIRKFKAEAFDAGAEMGYEDGHEAGLKACRGKTT